jgi:hypothetical protein
MFIDWNSSLEHVDRDEVEVLPQHIDGPSIRLESAPLNSRATRERRRSD